MDEPFYAAYLQATGEDHPMRADILAAHETDPVAVAQSCLAEMPTPHVYMKHMPHHMIEGFPLDWAEHCVNVHLIRHPARVIASYATKWPDVSFDQIGFRQQAAVYDRLGGVIVDSFDVRQDPERTLQKLCSAIDLSFDPAMLQWPAGARAEDGIWAERWYGAVHRSTGFAGPECPLPALEGRYADLLAQAMPYYDALATRAIR